MKSLVEANRLLEEENCALQDELRMQADSERIYTADNSAVSTELREAVAMKEAEISGLTSQIVDLRHKAEQMVL